MGKDRNPTAKAANGAAPSKHGHRISKSNHESESEPDPHSDSNTDLDEGSRKSEARRKRSKSSKGKTRTSSSKRKRYRDDDSCTSSSYYDSESESESDYSSDSEKEKMKMKDKRRRDNKKEKDKGKKGVVTNSWRKYGIIKETDMWNKRLEFTAWLAEVKQQSVEVLRDESLIHLDDATIPDQPSSEEVNSMFKHVVDERKNVRTYGCGSMTSMIYPNEMAPRPRGVESRSSQDLRRMREMIEQQNRVIEYLLVDLQALQRRSDKLDKKYEMLKKKNEMLKKNSEMLKKNSEMLKSRLSTLEDQIRHLVSGMPQVAPMHPHTQSYDRVLHGQSASSRGRSIAHLSRPDPHAAGSSRGDRFAVFSSRPDLRSKRLSVAPSYLLTSSQDHMYSQRWVGSSQDFRVHNGDDDDNDDDDGDDDDAYDDDETQTP